jgi:hypothetical protein
MRFERGKDVKSALNIGIPCYSIYRMQVFKTTTNAAGFYMLTPPQARETLEKLERGELARANYAIEFSCQYEELRNKVEMNLYELRTCFLQYDNKKYLIKSHINAI